MRVVNGIHVCNSRAWDVEQMLRLDKGRGAVTILHHMMFPRDEAIDQRGDVENAYWYWKLRHGWPAQGIPPAPERLIHVRLFQPNWRDHEPKALARHAAQLLSQWRFEGLSADLWQDPLVCVSPCNEQNLEPVGDKAYAVHARWQLDFWSEIDRVLPDRKALACLGAWAYGGDWLPDVPDSEYMEPTVRELLDYVDVLATHPYAHLEWPGPPGAATCPGGQDAYWHMLRDFRPAGYRDAREPHKPHDPGGILAQVPGKPLLISESGTFVHSDKARTAETLAAMRGLLEAAAASKRCLGVTWFIWNSGPEHAGNIIWPNEDLRRGLEALPPYETPCPVPVRGQSAPAPAPSPTPSPAPGPVEPRLLVHKGDGWYNLVRRCGRTANHETVRALRAANPGLDRLAPGQWVLSPWHEVRERGAP